MISGQLLGSLRHYQNVMATERATKARRRRVIEKMKAGSLADVLIGERLRLRMTTIIADATLWKSRTSISPESGWRNTHKFSKYPVQVRCIAEPYRERHLAKREFRLGQQPFCAVDPLR